MFCKDI